MTARKCALEECDNLIYKGANYKWKRYCCIEHSRISTGRILSGRRQRIDLERVEQLAAQGAYATNIAEEFNVSLYAAWQFVLKHNIELKYSHRSCTPTRIGVVSEFWEQHDAELIAGYEAGATLTAIAKTLNVTVGAVAGRLTRLDRIGERKFPASKLAELPKNLLLGGCMWPMGDGWCGAEVKHRHSYCEEHAGQAHRPTAPLSIEALV